MSATLRSTLLTLFAGPLLLAGCAATGPDAAPPPAVSTTASAEPSAEPSPEPSGESSGADAPTGEAAWHRFSTENGMASIAVPPTWTVEGGAVSSDVGEWQWIWVRNSLRHEMALLRLGVGGDRGGACGGNVIAGTSDVPARIHLVEEVDVTGETLGDAPPTYLYAATVERSDGAFAFHAGYSLERPADDRMPCIVYDDVAVPVDYPQVSFGVPDADIGGGLWRVDSLEAGEAYAQTEEYETLMDVLRSLRLQAGS
ncbi:hypothetical protein [Agrococcus sp. Ld7]|uniref:hypothetical protein n=1 Tax=Agrococcus sp. Ld7 TaxID=649148 RepID=UPI00386D9571